MVEQGQLLVQLNDTAAKASYDLLYGQYLTAKVQEQRLIAQRDDLTDVVLSDDVKSHLLRQEVAKQFDVQRRLFKNEREGIAGQVNVLKQQILQYEKQLEGLQAQRRSAKEQIELLSEEIDSVSELLEQGLAEKPRLLALKRNKADLEGKAGEFLSSMSRVKDIHF